MSRKADNIETSVGKVIVKYARFKGRSLAFCGPSRAETYGFVSERRGTNGKVIYRDLEAAEAAAVEMEAIGFGPQRAYLCPRSRHGHAHLTQRGT